MSLEILNKNSDQQYCFKFMPLYVIIGIEVAVWSIKVLKTDFWARSDKVQSRDVRVPDVSSHELLLPLCNTVT